MDPKSLKNYEIKITEELEKKKKRFSKKSNMRTQSDKHSYLKLTFYRH